MAADEKTQRRCNRLRNCETIEESVAFVNVGSRKIFVNGTNSRETMEFAVD
jgi:hypothetical protein